MARKSIGNRPMTYAERQPSFLGRSPVIGPRAPPANLSLVPAVPLTRAAVPSVGMTPSANCCRCKPNTPPGSRRCRPDWRMAQPPKRCRRFATSTSQIYKPSSHPEGSDGTDRSRGNEQEGADSRNEDIGRAGLGTGPRWGTPS